MEVVKKYGIIILLVLTAVILVLWRSTGTGHFRPGAERWTGPSVSRTNIITVDSLDILPGKKLIINLGSPESINKNFTIPSINITADSVLSKNIIRIIVNNPGPVMLFSPEPGLSARIWMVLSQMGIRNIYILTEETDNEVFKNKFRPDTLFRPEL